MLDVRSSFYHYGEGMEETSTVEVLPNNTA